MEKLQIPHETYVKINTLYKRDSKGKIMLGEYSRPEFEYLHDVKWRAFLKIDGTNMSYYWDGHVLEIHGKSENADISAKLRAKMESLLTVEKMSELFPVKYDEEGNEIPQKVIIYGEGLAIFGTGRKEFVKNVLGLAIVTGLTESLGKHQVNLGKTELGVVALGCGGGSAGTGGTIVVQSVSG